jgi:hypothetical protein
VIHLPCLHYPSTAKGLSRYAPFVDKSLRPNLKSEFKFVTFDLRRVSTSTFLKALHSQFALKPWPEMFKRPAFTRNIKVKFPAAKAVLVIHQSTAVNAEGQIIARSNILCSNREDFESFAHDLSNRLDIIYDIFLSSSSSKSLARSTMVKVSVVSRFPNSDDSSSELSSHKTLSQFIASFICHL